MTDIIVKLTVYYILNLTILYNNSICTNACLSTITELCCKLQSN